MTGGDLMTGFQFTRRYDPFRDLPRDVGRLLESFEPLQNWRVPRPFPPINVYDAQDRFVVRAELPGVAPEELDLSITGETLTLRGERRQVAGHITHAAEEAADGFLVGCDGIEIAHARTI